MLNLQIMNIEAIMHAFQTKILELYINSGPLFQQLRKSKIYLLLPITDIIMINL